MSYSEIKQAFRNISENTWNNINNAQRLNLKLGEVTITELIILYLEILGSTKIVTIPTSVKDEAIIGSDWEWRIGNDKLGWIKLFIQAKKLYRYYGFGYKDKKTKVLQVDKLRAYAYSNNGVPIYALYNYYELDDYSKYWHCNSLLEKDQLGVTLAHANSVKKLLKNGDASNFENIHLYRTTIPLSCLIDSIIKFLKTKNPKDFIYRDIPAIYETLADLEDNKPLIEFDENSSDIELLNFSISESDLKSKHIINIDIGYDDDPK